MPDKAMEVIKNSVAVKIHGGKDAIYWGGDHWFWIGTSRKVSKADIETMYWLYDPPPRPAELPTQPTKYVESGPTGPSIGLQGTQGWVWGTAGSLGTQASFGPTGASQSTQSRIERLKTLLKEAYLMSTKL